MIFVKKGIHTETKNFNSHNKLY